MLITKISAFALISLVSAAPISAASTSVRSSDKLKVTVQVVEGALQGFFDSPDFPHIESCITDGETAYDDLEKGFHELEELTVKSIEAGLKDIGSALQSTKTAMVDCKAVISDVEAFMNAIETGFRHPLSFIFKLGKTLLVNGREIYTEVKTAVADWHSESYRDAGFQIGRALAQVLNPTFEAWRSAHPSKTYSSPESENAARAAYEENLALAKALTRDGIHYRLNEFADISATDFTSTRNGYDPRYASIRGPLKPEATAKKTDLSDLPTAVDWRDHGLVAPVKNQGGCGSCWAFSTVVSLEGQHAKATGKLVPLSEQNLVDCVKGEKLPGDTDECCNGCNGGLMDDAFGYLVDKQGGGIATENAYPYRGFDEKCAWKEGEAAATLGGWKDIPAGDEDALLEAVATVGPVSIAVDASIGWQLYFGGIMHGTLCSSNPKKMDHGVAIVGYGTEHGKDYWIVRNSWGSGWGEHGYVRIIRGKNACGLANAASYPTGVAAPEVAA